MATNVLKEDIDCSRSVLPMRCEPPPPLIPFAGDATITDKGATSAVLFILNRENSRFQAGVCFDFAVVQCDQECHVFTNLNPEKKTLRE